MKRIEIITAAVRIGFFILSVFIIPAVIKWMNTQTDNEKLNRIKMWASTAVSAAEQIHNKWVKDDPNGELRRKMAYRSIRRFADKIGIPLTSDEIDDILECAVHELNNMHTKDEIAAPEEVEE